MTEKSAQRKKREKNAEQFQEALKNYNGNPDTKTALEALANELNLDI